MAFIYHVYSTYVILLRVMRFRVFDLVRNEVTAIKYGLQFRLLSITKLRQIDWLFVDGDSFKRFIPFVIDLFVVLNRNHFVGTVPVCGNGRALTTSSTQRRTCFPRFALLTSDTFFFALNFLFTLIHSYWPLTYAAKRRLFICGAFGTRYAIRIAIANQPTPAER